MGSQTTTPQFDDIKLHEFMKLLEKSSQDAPSKQSLQLAKFIWSIYTASRSANSSLASRGSNPLSMSSSNQRTFASSQDSSSLPESSSLLSSNVVSSSSLASSMESGSGSFLPEDHDLTLNSLDNINFPRHPASSSLSPHHLYLYIGLILIVQVVVIMLVLDRVKTVKSCRPKKIVRFGWYHQNSSCHDSPSTVITEERRVVKQPSTSSKQSVTALPSNASGSNISSDLFESSGLMTSFCFMCQRKKSPSPTSPTNDYGSRDLFNTNEIMEEGDFGEEDDYFGYDEDEELDDDEDIEGCQEEQRKQQKGAFLSQTYSLIYNPSNKTTRTSCLSLQTRYASDDERRTRTPSSSKEIVATYV